MDCVESFLMRDSRLIALKSFFLSCNGSCEDSNDLWSCKSGTGRMQPRSVRADPGDRGCVTSSRELAKITVTLRPFHTHLVLQQLWDGQ